MICFHNLQSHPFPLTLVSRQPDRGESTGAELVHNSVASIIIHVIEVNRMKSSAAVSLDVFGVSDTLRQKEASVILPSRI
jgi:hypothetical protein